MAEGDKQVRFTALLHHIYNPERLKAAYFALKRDAAPGVDGETWHHYGEALEANLDPGFGWLQALGVISGALVIAVGLYLRRPERASSRQELFPDIPSPYCCGRAAVLTRVSRRVFQQLEAEHGGAILLDVVTPSPVP